MEDSYEKEKRLYFIVDGSVLMHFVFGFCAGRRREKQISGGHSWAEVNGRVYDPDWAKVTGKIELYGGMNYNVTGPGIPRYKGNRLYVKKYKYDKEHSCGSCYFRRNVLK